MIRREIRRALINVLFALLWLVPVSLFIFDFFTFEELKQTITNEKFYKLLMFSISQAAISALISLFVAAIPAYYAAKRDDKLSAFINSLLFIPFFFPAVSMVISFAFIYGSNGLIYRATGIEIGIMYTFWAIVAGNVFYNTPIFVKYITEAVRRVPHEVIETAMADGAGKWKIFFWVEMPMIASHILKGFMIVFTYCFTGFIVIMALGGIRYSNFEVEIANIMRNGLNFGEVTIYALFQFLVLYIINLFTLKERDSYYGERKSANGKIPVWVAVGAIVYIIYEVSILVVSLSSAFFNYYTGQFELEGLRIIFSSNFIEKYRLLEAFRNSATVSIFTGIFTVVTCYVLLKNKTKWSIYIVLSVMGLSSAFLGAATVYFGITTSVPMILMLVTGYIIILIPPAYVFMAPFVEGIDRTVLEAAKIDGAGRIETFIYIEFPLLLPIFAAAFLQSAAISFGEFTIAYTMQMQDDFPLVSILNFSLDSMRKVRESGAISSISVLMVFFMFFLSHLIVQKKGEN